MTSKQPKFPGVDKHLSTDAFIKLGFKQVTSWMWISEEYNLRIEYFGEVTDAYFSITKPYYLFNKNVIATPFSGKEIKAGKVADIVTAVHKLVIREQGS
ncbi:hypothetical protein [uncultured Pontibacter sp.]|uniref:hypothetical protein n=1 Tax=uncultured Pontibacter sp. TaxID=453356 RepID=UPI00263456CC|nr:hypothetical protein [uncultured Pontibacter sp.]